MVFYFVTKGLVPGSLLQQFVDGDDEFRNSRFKIIPSVPKVLLFSKVFVRRLLMQEFEFFLLLELTYSYSTQGSWIVRQSVGAKPCLVGKAVDITYIRGPSYLEVTLSFCFSLSVQTDIWKKKSYVYLL
jgi:Protein ENHANCED DISEASE RESISTANCE 2, C-terminal